MPIHNLSPFGAPKYLDGAAIAATVATFAALTALAAADPARTHGNEVKVDADGSRWYWHATSTLTGDDILVAAADDAPTAGRWLRCEGFVDLAVPFSAALADGATILTIPAGCRFKLESAHYEITTLFAGGSSSAIGIAATSPFNTAGDILGGGSGDVEAGLTAGVRPGTIGAKMDTDAELHTALFVATNTFTYEEITSAFTSGAGYVHLVGFLLRNAGA